MAVANVAVLPDDERIDVERRLDIMREATARLQAEHAEVAAVVKRNHLRIESEARAANEAAADSAAQGSIGASGSAGPAPAADADEPMEATRASPAPRSAAEITADLPRCQRPQPGGQGEAPQACR